jgi:GNAT superfamily N-acetyltransferase
VAELDGHVVGHVCVVGPASRFPAADMLNEVCAQAHHCDTSDLAWISTLFVAAEARGHGIGRLLMKTAVDQVRHSGGRPCLEVLPAHPAAMALYMATGWRVVHRFRPDWLSAVVGEEEPGVHVMVLTDTRH